MWAAAREALPAAPSRGDGAYRRERATGPAIDSFNAQFEQIIDAVIETHEDELDGLPVVWRSAPGADPPTLWLHGVPDSSDLWTPLLERA